MTVFTFVFKRFFRKKSNFIYLLLLPIGVVFLPEAEWPAIPLGFQYYGVVLLFLASKLGAIILEDRTDNVLIRMSVSPITHFRYLWENLLAYSIILTSVNIIAIIIGVMYHGNAVPSPILLFIIYSIFSMTALGFSLAWYSLFRNRETAFAIIGIIVILMAMLGGVMWPVELMPDVLQRVVMLLPTFWYAEAMHLLSLEEPMGKIMIPLIMMILFSIAFLLIGSRRRIA
ncbi:ABC transporter permease [Evansella cellulosilytica]|uniref:ABC-2 type transporter n=1 Tax=Evansella cellulosilytica (strain ATCC 21833 / DSM 2522 / FERM P-1141 / JCM 9156 / N-4) TaxID=649639 RepID=E6TSQ3_EVAC2|nr:ABC transporter permease [Evansella cellulosilytica]ADU29561.1 ABC-2 type transporter [Evansella cellulosilytica DSM 2522]